MENPTIVGKTTTAHRLQKITMRRIQQWGNIEAMTSCTPSSPHGGYDGGNDLSISLSLTLSVYTVTLCTHTTTKCSTTQLCIRPKSYLYTYDFRAIYTYGPKRGSQEHIYICVPSNRSGDFHRVLDHPVLHNFPFEGTCFRPNSPFTLT